MKKLIIILSFLLFNNLVISQKISPDFILPKEGVNYYSIYLTIEDLKLSQTKDFYPQCTTITIGELKKNKYKKREGGYDYFAIDLPKKSPYYGIYYTLKREDRWRIGWGRSINTHKSQNFNSMRINKRGELVISMVGDNGNNYIIYVSKISENKYSTIIRESNKKGKVKIYFSENSVLKRVNHIPK